MELLRKITREKEKNWHGKNRWCDEIFKKTLQKCEKHQKQENYQDIDPYKFYPIFYIFKDG